MPAWYEDKIKYEVPAYIIHFKELVARKIAIMAEIKEVGKEMQRGIDFFSESGKPQDKILVGAQQFKRAALRLYELESQINQIDGELIGGLEVKMADIAFRVRMPAQQDEAGNTTPIREFVFTPWASLFEGDDKHVIISPDQAWFFSLAKTLFGANAANIEFIPKGNLYK